MPLEKKNEEEETETIKISDEAEVQILGPYTNTYKGKETRSVRVETKEYGAFVGDDNLKITLKEEIKDRSFRDEKDKLREVVKDTSKLNWTKNYDKKKGKGVDMGPTNDILKDIKGYMKDLYEVAQNCEKDLDAIVKIFKKVKKKGD